MPDHATSTSPAVQTQLDRLWALSPGADILGLDRITRLLARIGDPHERLPPVLHVAGTNGKGSTCAFLRSAIEAAGYSCHVYTSPHLVRFNERIRLAGALIDDAALAGLLAEVLDVGGDIGASFFEVTTAAAFLAFSRVPADACIVEVGLGGRLDATNVVTPLVCGIAQLGVDHQAFLGDTLEQIAGEKAGIAKPGVPLVTMAYPPAITARIAAAAGAAGAPVVAQNQVWSVTTAARTLRYADPGFALAAPRPSLAGRHQADNLGLAIAMLRHQGLLSIPEAAIRAAALWTRWPARMQRLGDGPLTRRLPPGSGVWLDGAHNPSAAREAGRAFRRASRGPRALVAGLLANKDPLVITELARGVDTLVAVPVPGHEHHAPEEVLAHGGAATGLVGADVFAAFDTLAARASGPLSVLVAGSLYLAGEVLAANDEPPE